MSNQLSAQQIQQIKGLYELSDDFRNAIDQSIGTGLTRAKALVAQLSKLSLNGTSDETTVKTPKKRGRPVGSKNTKPSKPRAKKEAPAVETTVSEGMTHGAAIQAALQGSEGLSAGAIFEAITKAKHKGYNIPAIATLYTTLSGMKKKGSVKMIGEKPNTKYVLP
jgi:hypothetical protein